MSKHIFEPARYYNTIGPHEPVLHIQDGDSVTTTTIDSRGYDKHSERQISGPNPMTGPFYIEGAEAGDTLAVTFDDIKPNRATGWTGNIIDSGIVELSTVASLPERELLDWNFDLAEGVAIPPKEVAALQGLKPKLAPFLGCFGVAPARGETITTASSAEHGGNMDYRRFQVGTTAYFPVFEPGALFFLGDGHGLQGDGEIIGTGIETSMDVQFTVKVMKGKTINWPRGEDNDHIFTIGNARPLELALQHATSEMMRWLSEDYGLDSIAASVLLGHYVEYEVGNIYNPAYTMACKLKKSVLLELQGK